MHSRQLGRASCCCCCCSRSLCSGPALAHGAPLPRTPPTADLTEHADSAAFDALVLVTAEGEVAVNISAVVLDVDESHAEAMLEVRCCCCMLCCRSRVVRCRLLRSCQPRRRPAHSQPCPAGVH